MQRLRLLFDRRSRRRLCTAHHHLALQLSMPPANNTSSPHFQPSPPGRLPPPRLAYFVYLQLRLFVRHALFDPHSACHLSPCHSPCIPVPRPARPPPPRPARSRAHRLQTRSGRLRKHSCNSFRHVKPSLLPLSVYQDAFGAFVESAGSL
ncbi:hypothetical protein BD413DRAFT_90826 [Trametes elegans]|nr:hypothetical protein BD413DRAFT_90826 [Trametes elegans]